VAKTATVGLHGNTYEVDAALVGRRVELVFDPLREVSRNGSYAQPRIMLSADLGLLRGDPFRLSEFA
jgi:hypothetical protein